MELGALLCVGSERVPPCFALASPSRGYLCGGCEFLLCDLLYRRVGDVGLFDSPFADNDLPSRLCRLGLSGLAYVFIAVLLPKWSNYTIRQTLVKLDDGAQATQLVKVPNAELKAWDATHDEHGAVIASL